ncbi:MAG TPA: hypothetical protein VNG33_11850 [Polyangiaceae bacterium]|nr:hypothetical protein [Polyangiaceae bacterium]
MKRNPAAGGSLVHPAFIAALCVLVLNDHVLKHACPGVITGKLSDFAGVLLLPLFLHALIELGRARAWQRPLSARGGDRVLLCCVVVSLLAFTLPEVWQPAELAYRYGLGALRWPFQLLFALATGDAPPGLRPVRATADVSDLLALSMALVAYRIGRRGAARTPSAAAQVSAVSHSTW